MRAALFFAFSVLATSSTAIAECRPNSIPIYVVAGQSNAVGAGEVGNLPNEYRYLIQVAPNKLAWNYRTGTIEPLQIGVNNNLLHDWNGIFGPEAMIASQLSEKSNESFIVFKYAVSGTSLESDWNSEKNGSLYFDFLTAASRLNQALAKTGQTACYKAFFWMQGEADLGHSNIRRYKENFVRFKDGVRRSLNAMNLPFILGRISSPPTPEFDKIQNEIADADPFVRLVETRDLSKHGDDVHYDTLGQIELGRRFYNSFDSTDWGQVVPADETFFKVWPNPYNVSHGTLKVSIQTTVQRCENVTLQMFGVDGKELRPLFKGVTVEANDDSNPFQQEFPADSFEGVAAAPYILRLHMDGCSNGKDPYLTQKIIVIR